MVLAESMGFCSSIFEEPIPQKSVKSRFCARAPFGRCMALMGEVWLCGTLWDADGRADKPHSVHITGCTHENALFLILHSEIVSEL